MCPFDFIWKLHGFILPRTWHFLWPAFLAACVSLVIGALTLGREYWKRVYVTHWYDISKVGWLGRLEWDEVEKLMSNDPLDHQPSRRWGSRHQRFKDSCVLVILIVLWFIGVQGTYLLDQHFHSQDIEVAVHLVGVLGIAGAAAKAVYEWRLKARTENRQKWVNELRDTLATLIESMPLPSRPREDEKQKQEAYFKAHGKLELLMNPSEKDHRGLTTLIRRIYGHSELEIDKVPLERLGISKLSPDGKEDFEKLKSNTIRLANVVLKREWERVKHIK